MAENIILEIQEDPVDLVVAEVVILHPDLVELEIE
jgi:hypothetical protein